jgi:hypothetical protein
MKDKRVLIGSGASLLTFWIAVAELRQSYDFDYNEFDSESPNRSPLVVICLRDHKLEPWKLKVRESRQKKRLPRHRLPKLLRKLPKIPHFLAVRFKISTVVF